MKRLSFQRNWKSFFIFNYIFLPSTVMTLVDSCTKLTVHPLTRDFRLCVRKFPIVLGDDAITHRNTRSKKVQVTIIERHLLSNRIVQKKILNFNAAVSNEWEWETQKNDMKQVKIKRINIG